MESRSTRSQVTLPDEILQVSQESPLKKARSSRRNRANTNSSSTESNGTEHRPVEDDDELLLSPRKVEQSSTEGNSSKRSVSPPVADEYAESSSPTTGRELKRLKTDFNFEKLGPVKSTRKPRSAPHIRNLSDPNGLPAGRASRQTSKSTSRKPNSIGHKPFHGHSSPPPDRDTGRAQSVPLFPSLSFIPHIDLHKPPPSPSRNRSRSLSKESTPKLRITPLPSFPSLLESIQDESTTPMNVDIRTTQLAPAPSLGEPISIDDVSAIEESPVEPDLSVKFSGELQFKGAETPVAIVDTPSFGWSPLTPVPETPHPMKLAVGEEKIAAISWELESEEAPPRSPMANMQTTPKPSLLPRPSLNNIAQTARTQQKSQAVPAPKKLQASKITSGSQKTVPNAFDILMKKAPARTKPAGKRPSVVATKSILPIPSTSKSGNRIRLAMKPKPKGVDSVPAPAPVPIPEDEDDIFLDEEVNPWNNTGEGKKADTKAQVKPALPVLRIEEGSSLTKEPDFDSPLTDLEEEIRQSPDICLPSALASTSETTLAETNASVKINVELEGLAAPEAPPEVEPIAQSSQPRRQSKLPRLPSSIPTNSRTTRSSSTKVGKPTTEPPASAKSKANPGRSVKPSSSRTAKVPAVAVPEKETGLPTAQVGGPVPEKIEVPEIPPFGSPMKVSPIRPAAPKSSLSLKAMSVIASPSKSKIPTMHHTASPSPPKLARSTSLFSRPVSENRFNAGGSTLSTLSSALEKLRMPAPARPNTSMGFNRDLDDDDDSPVLSKSQIQDDSEVGKKTAGQSNGKGASLRRSTTLNSNHFSDKGLLGITAGSLPTKQSTLFFPKTKAGGPGRGKPGIGVGWGKAPKASKNPGLATVIGSPVKGGHNPAMEEDQEESEAVGEAVIEDNSPFLTGLTNDVVGKGKAKQWDDFSTRRASMVSHLLSESLNSFPSESTSGKGLMGPPAVPNLSARSTSSQSPGSATGESSTPPGRRSTRIAAVAAAASTSKKAAEPEKPVVNEALKFLKDCVIYVDVKTDESEEAGSLFVEMLEGVGAKLLGRVGQSCTHIVYKNGLQSTINRYKLLRDPKPLVVGIAWVVDCVEQRKKVDETDYLIDLEEVSLLTNPTKRRRSMLPKLVSRQFSDISMHSESAKDDSIEGDVSMESASSAALDDLTPLERARRRKSMLPT